MAAPSPLHVAVVDWGVRPTVLKPSVWIGTNLDYVARASAAAIWRLVQQSYRPSHPARVVGDPNGLAHRDLLDWHRALHEITTTPDVVFYYASVEGGEAMPVVGWLDGDEPDD